MTDIEMKSPDEAEEARLDARAEAEIDAQNGVPHDRVRKWLAKLGRGEKAPPRLREDPGNLVGLHAFSWSENLRARAMIAILRVTLERAP